MRRIRGKEIAMVFQEPMTSLNPVLTLGAQIGEAIKLHQGGTRQEVRERVITVLQLVGIPEPEKRLSSYPHELSGGMRQRVMIAMALSCSPVVLIADEPTTALDVTIQAQILDLLANLREQLGMAVMLITHNLGLVAQQAAEVVVMYAGRVVERASVTAVFAQSLHPYTVALLRSVPRQGQARHRLETIPGSVPDLSRLPAGCAFRDRCPQATGECAVVEPRLEEKRPHHWVACIHA
jgi:peptide/nickel transport system ATP-binding protein